MEEHKSSPEGFRYSYSAREQEELRRIRQKYAPSEEDKMEYLRRLDRGVTEKAAAVSIAVGVIGTLLMGLGMACVLEWQGRWLAPGIVLGVMGIAILSAAYPIHNHVLRKEREKIAPEILRLTDELLE